ncbi:MAG: cation:proton antiporter [Candidatus Pristimantibacillus lignocellulolyticus]|uniref:Cation:proton antiporter n=1 Tax=Candidatus Pristimantibacillus lignocellulolyticus TaxID=2994561 RepID=A0A9J6ZEJ2_9BACL|nr:MAG: cation:proton antiporter [Candidatus Pristimantibacillus lignocellulolyticus]
MEFIITLVIILLSTKISGHISVKLGQPAVLGKLIIGIVLGPAVFGWVQSDELLTTFANIGVLLLMFIAGLETDIEQMKKTWKSALAVAIGGIILPFIGGYTVGLAFGFSSNHSLFFATLFCATSVSISVQVLKELDQLNSREGATILGAAVIDDVLVVILLAFMMSFTGADEGSSIGMLVLNKVIFFVIIVLASIFIVPLLMKCLGKLKVTEPVISIAIVICFGFAYFAEYMHMAGIIGAFAAGIAVGQTPFRKTVEHKVEPIAYTLFVPVFFVSIGLDVSFVGIGDQIGFLIIITIMAIVTKLIGCWVGARLTGFNSKPALIIGAGMVSRGEVALIIAATGLSSQLLHPEYFTSIVIMVIVTTIVTPPLLKFMFTKNEKVTA